MKKNFMGLLLTAAMCLSLLPSTALAEELPTQAQELTEQENPVTEEVPAEEIQAEEIPAEETEQEEPAAMQEIAEQGIAVQATSATVDWYDGVDAIDGNITKVNVERNGEFLENSSMDVTLTEPKYYVVQGDVTIQGNLTIGSSSNGGGLILCQGATLTVEGALIHSGGTSFFIYGQTGDNGKTGRLIINNSDGDGAAIRSTANNSQLCISSGELTINGGNVKELVDKVALYSSSSVHKAALDGKTIPLADWRYKSSISGGELVLAYCKHDDATYKPSGDTQHTKHCADCGFVGIAKDCGNDGVDGYVSGGEKGHYQQCPCGNKFGSLIAHDANGYLLSKNNQMHIAGCGTCGYQSGSPEQHVWVDGVCTLCKFEPVATGDYDYIFESVQDALDTLAKGDTISAELYSGDSSKKKINQDVVFNYPGKTLTLNMNGYTLENDGSPVITVEAGTLKITGDAVINQTGQTTDLAAPAIKVTGGKLIFENDLTAHGGTYPSANLTQQNPAVYANGGELEFNGDLDLQGGLKITGDAKLTQGLTQGTFSVDTGVKNTKRLSVEGAKNYKYLRDLLANGHALVDKDTNRYLVASYDFWTGDATIVAHEHTWEKPASGDIYTCTVCGEACAHEGGFESGKCEVCGKPCPHEIADQSPTDHYYYCNDCGQKMAARIQTDTYKWAHYTDLVTAIEAVTDGQTVTLLDDVDNSDKYVCITGDNKTVTLDLKGHTITGGYIQVGIDRNWNNYTSITLKIVGNGSIKTSGNLSVGYSATLDLSGWSGGEIAKVSLQKNGKITPNPESLLIVGENIGTIGSLGFLNWPSAGVKTKLNGGTYGEISIVVQYNSEPFGSLLEPGYAFQYIDSGEFVEYTKTATNRGNTISNVRVVCCPHEKVENGTCAYCGTTGIAAVLDGRTVYNDINTALNAWMTSGRELTLHTDSSISGATWVGSGERVLNLNGHVLTGGKPDLASGLYLTIQDNSASGTGRIDNLKVNSGAKLTLESGEIRSLDVESAADGDVKLRGGTVTSSVSGGNGTVLVYKLLEDGYYLEGSALLATFSGGPYEVKNANITVGGEKTGEIAIGKNIVNIPVSLTLTDTSTTAVTFDWYLVDTNKNGLSKLASVDAAVTNGVADYDPTTAVKSTEAGWDRLAKDTDYTLICMATGMAGAEISWQAALTGYTLHMLPPSIEDADITFNGNWRVKTFWPDSNNNSVGKVEISRDLGAYVVKFGNIELKEGTDYTVSGNVATQIGTQYLTITGIAPNYSGTKTVQWTVVPHKLKMLEIKQISKQYDGTVALPDGAFSEYFNSADGYGQITLKEGTDYVVTDACFDTADASSENKGYRYTVELKNPNYVFADDSKVHTAVYGEEAHTTVSITKADAPTATERGTLTVTNNTAAEYTFDFASLLPALESPKEYGTLHYSNDTYDGASYGFAAGYYGGNMTLDAATGKLTLPIQAVNSTEEGKIGSITVIVSSTNFENFEVTLDINAENRKTTSGGGGGGSKKHTTPSTPKDEEISDNANTADNTTAPKEDFADVPADAWFKEAVDYVNDKGLMSGVDKDNFAPKVLTNRAMLVTILWRLESCPTSGQTTDFNDMKTSDYFHNAVLWAAENKIVSGISETSFAPNNSITREQLAAILYRYAVYKGYDVTQGGMAVREFSDYESISDYARGSVAWAVNTGILSGKGENTLDPKGVATRAEVASMLMRFCENIAK